VYVGKGTVKKNFPF